MRPPGSRPVRFPSKVDHHIRENHRKVPNWWETEMSVVNKAIEKREVESEIKEELADLGDSAQHDGQR
jgi:hypothetical protein